MGLRLSYDQAVPGGRVRHRRNLWTGTITSVMPARELIEVEPDGLDGGTGRPQWFDRDELEPWPIQVERPPVDGHTELERRYLTDGVFHQLVTYQRQLLKMATAADVRDALGLAEDIERRRIERDARLGRSPIQDVKDFDRVTLERIAQATGLPRTVMNDGAAGDDVRGKGQTDAQEGRGTHGPGQQKP